MLTVVKFFVIRLAVSVFGGLYLAFLYGCKRLLHITSKSFFKNIIRAAKKSLNKFVNDLWGFIDFSG